MEKRNELGFLQHYQNPLIDKIQFCFDGNCVIYLKDGSTRTHFVDCGVSYNKQFGIPISPDGMLLFVSSWEKGLTAYHTLTGEKIWHFRSTRIGTVLAYSNFLLAHRYCSALLRLDLSTGTLIQETKSGTIECIQRLDERYVFIDRLRGKYCVIDAETEEIYKNYPNKTVNPRNCWSLCIRTLFLEDGQLYAEGFEGYPNKDYNNEQQEDFYRMLDADFYKQKEK